MAEQSDEVRALTFNIFLDGHLGLPQVIDVIRTSKADVIGLQESEKETVQIAGALGFNYVQHGYTALITRFKIDSVTPGNNCIVVHTDDDHKLAFCDKHLFYKPYQPYQLLGIPFEGVKIYQNRSGSNCRIEKSSWSRR